MYSAKARHHFTAKNNANGALLLLRIEAFITSKFIKTILTLNVSKSLSYSNYEQVHVRKKHVFVENKFPV